MGDVLKNRVLLIAAGLLLSCAPALFAEETVTVDDLRKAVDDLRKQVSARPELSVTAAVDHSVAVHEACEVNPDVETRTGHLTIGGLLQVWGYSIQNDRKNWVDIQQVLADPRGTTAPVNSTADNDSFRIRRSELRFDYDLDCNIRAHVMMDPSNEATAFPDFPSNQGSGPDGDALFFSPCNCNSTVPPPFTDPRNFYSGVGTNNRLLQEAWIDYHDFVPHHDFRIGEMRRQLGEEGSRDSGDLDFVERAMITQLADLRDLGVQVHGYWLDDRINYWIGAFDDAGTAFQHRANRSDDNDQKDLAATLKVIPVRDGKWGTLELGASILYGVGGEAGGPLEGTDPVNGLDRRRTTHGLAYAWAMYHPGGPAKGFWARGEWGQYRDRFAPGEAQSGFSVVTLDPAPFIIDGWDFAAGYRLNQSVFADDVASWAKPFEFAFRYDVMQNLFYHDLVAPDRRLDVFKTQVYTAGINYYLSENTKLQLNYNWTREGADDDNGDRQLREVKNNSLVLSLQVEF